ncbi:MAG: BON domain-containing protein [Gammaproteobacteria bacterium]|nr:BON domain-containing protein [Gammaproteobacteria bacterium]MBU2477869.1 BON domain-containing protein [Gammaproteobacteria bacterium]
MNVSHPLVVSALLLNLLLQGCAPVLIGGAATGASVAHDRRTAGSYVEDQSIEMKAATAISNEAELKRQGHLNVTSFNMIVLISGEVPSEALRQRAGELIGGIEKVRRVHNELMIAAPSSMMTRSSDSLITAKVKTSLFSVKGYENFDPTRVKVVTENGTVFLMGLLTRAEGAATAITASGVGGVQRVVKLFEYMD